jgi:hypothetical protein
MSLTFHILSKLTANKSGQKKLRIIISITSNLRGVGVGAQVVNSGETSDLDYLPSNPTAFDVSANRRGFALSLFRRHPCAKLQCFKPSKKTFSKLVKSISRIKPTVYIDLIIKYTENLECFKAKNFMVCL